MNEKRKKEVTAWIVTDPQTGKPCELFVALRTDEDISAVQCLVQHEVLFVVERQQALVAPATTMSWCLAALLFKRFRRLVISNSYLNALSSS